MFDCNTSLSNPESTLVVAIPGQAGIFFNKGGQKVGQVSCSLRSGSIYLSLLHLPGIHFVYFYSPVKYPVLKNSLAQTTGTIVKIFALLSSVQGGPVAGVGFRATYYSHQLELLI